MKINQQEIFLEALMKAIDNAAVKIDPDDTLNEKEVTIQFTVRNANSEIKCPAGCFKQSNGKCLCLKPFVKN